MFCGFNDATLQYYEAIRRENSKINHKENEKLYIEGVKRPLEELYLELYNFFNTFDRDLLGNKRSSLSSAYNDARFSHDTPIKEYFYVRFKLNKANKKNAPGFFFDASLDGYKYGLNIYKADARGMERIREYLMDNGQYAVQIIQQYNQTDLLEIRGEMYKRPNYPNENPILQPWLERKNISFIHEGDLDAAFFDREILNRMCASFESVKDVYFMLKEAVG